MKTISFLTALLFANLSPLSAQTQRPNIVLILADDMGWSDLGCYGGELKTPNIDQLAKEGLRFTQFYNGSRCCPSRASILTGLYAHQAGVGHMTDECRDKAGNIYPGYSGRLNKHCVTIAEVLGQAGYFTAMTGKWHVGQNFGVTPDERGFQRTLTSAAGGFYYPESRSAKLYYNGRDVGKTGGPLPKHWYSSDLCSSFGLKFIDQALAEKKPFFLYTAFNAPHYPLQAPATDIARWRGKFKIGWDKLREERYQRQIAEGLVDPKWPLSPRLDEVPAWEELGTGEQDRFDNMMAVYAAVVERMDRAVGDLVAGLKQRGQLDNTLILFLSDNGGSAEPGVRGRADGRVLGNPWSEVYLGQCWATLNNTPFTRYKHYTDEGGIATPFIVHWPDGIAPGQRGSLEKQPGHIIDILATCADVAGATYPQTFNGHTITPLAGISLLPAFRREKLNRGQPLFWEHESNRAVRDGDMKLVALEDEPWRLYNMATDRSEQHDLAKASPELVKSLAKKWQAWAAASDVLPLGAWRDDVAQPGNNANPQTKFLLTSGARLRGEAVPDIANRGFTITAKFTATGKDGVILAQGGGKIGYSLSVHHGKLTFFIRNPTGSGSVILNKSLLGAVTAIAELKPNGTLSLSVGKHLVTLKHQKLLSSPPNDGLDVGDDKSAPVGPYSIVRPYKGAIESVKIQLDPR